MKKGRAIAAGGIVVLLTAGFLLMGHLGGCRQNCFNGRGFCPAFGHRGSPLKCMGENFKERVLSRIDACVEELELSTEQQERYGDIKHKLDENLTQGLERRKGFFLKLRKEICKENPDIEVVAGLIKGGLEQMPSHMEKNLDLFVSFYSMLDEGQREVLLNKFRKRTDCNDA